MGDNSWLDNIKNIIAGVFKIIGKFIKFIGGFFGGILGLILPYLLIIIVIIAILFAVVDAISAGFDSLKGIMTSIMGVQEDKFYGTRYFYYDKDFTTEDLKNTYLEFTFNIISDVNKTYSIGIDYTKAYNESSQISLFCLSFAKALNPSLSNPTLEQCTENINHYGFDETNIISDGKTEKELVLNSLADSTYEYTDKSITKNTLYLKYKEIYETTKYDYMRNVCSKIIIKDYIVAANKVHEIPKKNYFGFIYMPKQSIIMNEANFAFAVDEEKEIEVNAKYKIQEKITDIKNEKVDSTWFKNGYLEKSFDCKLNDYILGEFNAINKSNMQYLENEKTLFEICKDNCFNTYFKEEANKLHPQNLLENINTNNYFYLSINSDSPFNMGESYVNYN